jgi:hypothetical protein
LIRKFYDVVGSKGEAYSVILAFEEGKLIEDYCSCTCKFGSFYRWTKKNKGKICKHIKEVMKNERK